MLAKYKKYGNKINLFLCTSEDDETGVAFERKEDAIVYCKKNEEYTWTSIWYNYHSDLEF